MSNQDGTSALHMAAWKGYLGIVEQLLAAGAKPDRVDSNGHSPLHEAARNGHSDVARALLKAGAAPELQDSQGLTPAALARRAGFKELEAELADQLRKVLPLPPYSPVLSSWHGIVPSMSTQPGGMCVL